MNDSGNVNRTFDRKIEDYLYDNSSEWEEAKEFFVDEILPEIDLKHIISDRDPTSKIEHLVDLEDGRQMLVYPIEYSIPGYDHHNQIINHERIVPYSLTIIKRDSSQSTFIQNFMTNHYSSKYTQYIILLLNILIITFGFCILRKKTNQIVKPLDELIINLRTIANDKR